MKIRTKVKLGMLKWLGQGVGVDGCEQGGGRGSYLALSQQQ